MWVMKQYWVYMLECSDRSLYVGVTSNILQRVWQHEVGVFTSCYTFSRRPVKLVFSTVYSRVDDAIWFEKRVKGWSRAKKLALIAGDWDEIRRLAAGGASTAFTSR